MVFRLVDSNWFDALGVFVNGGLLICAILALSTWKKQRLSNLAEEITLHAHSMKAIISEIRNPFSFAGEVDRQKGETESEELSIKYDAYYVPLARIKKNKDVLNSQFLMFLKAQLHFPKIADELLVFRNIIIDVRVSAEQLMSMADDEYADTKYDVKELRKIIYGRRNDTIDLKAEQSLSKIEEHLKRYL